MRYIILCILLSSCGASYNLRRAERHIAKAVAKGAEIKDDTVYKEITVIVPSSRAEQVITAPNWADTVVVTKDSITVKILRIPGTTTTPETVYIQAECPEKTVTKKVPIAIKRQIKAGYTLWDMIILALVCLAVGYFLIGPIVRTVTKVVKKVV